MHRFRKKSDTRRSDQLPFPSPTETAEGEEPLPQLPLSNDFRTSLILPDLSRRFSLLRSSSGDPASFEALLKSRFAEQRARGFEYQVTEEEEDMILESLRGKRSRNTGQNQKSQENVIEDDPSVRQSVQSTSTTGSSLAPSSLSSPATSRSTKRYSNNLFGSGRFRDYTYMRSVTRSTGSRTQSLTPTESSVSFRGGNASSISESLRPTTPDGSALSSSIQLSPSEKPPTHSSTSDAAVPYTEPPLSTSEYRVSKTLGPSVLKRASLALEEAIKEIEEVEDEIVMPRSTPIPRPSLEQPSNAVETLRHSDLSQSSAFEPGMAISSDKDISSDSEARRASPVPSRIMPGYIPGMPRPMTPRDIDPEDQRSHSTTPRATSPTSSSFADMTASSIPNHVTSGLFRRGSTSSQSRQSPHLMAPTSPLFLQRSTNGRYTPDDGVKDGPVTEFESPLNSSILTRRRPASPLSGAPFQPLTVSSRPSTPSNIVWTTNGQDTHKGHRRDDSWVSDSGVSSSDIHGAIDRHIPGTRSLRSPALPDSPTLDGGVSSMSSFVFGSGETSQDIRSSSKMSISELGSPHRWQRSPTPTQNLSRPAASPLTDVGLSSQSNSKRSSKQNNPSNLFNLGPIPPLVFSPLANSSRSSLESAGSSYHSWEGEKDQYLNLFNDVGAHQPAWHEISTPESSSDVPGGTLDNDWDAEDIISRYAGLKKSDFMAIQEKLVVAAAARDSVQDRAPSAMRRRRPSTSQSNYSVNGREPRVASPPPQVVSTPQPVSTPVKSDRDIKTSALLNSMLDSIDSIQTSRDYLAPLEIGKSSPPTPLDKELSPKSRRNRDLANALFGQEEPEVVEKTPSSDSNTSIRQRGTPTPISKPEEDLPVPPSAPNPTPVLAPASNLSPYQMKRNPSVPRIPQSPQEEAELAREVQQKMNAATLALKPSEAINHGGSIRKRISPNQISTPRLVSSSNNVDAVPIPRTPMLSSNNSGSSTIGSRFKKLRGTLRAKNVMPNGDEVTPYPLNPQSPPAVQTANYDPDKLKVPGLPVVTSATESGRFKVPVPSPPASAGPGLKGFMARFRSKQRNVVDASSDAEHRRSPQFPPPQSFPTTKVHSKAAVIPSAPDTMSTPTAQSAETPQAWLPSPPAQSEDSESTALKQLFDAATKIGLDQGALNDLLARSASTSSRSTEWTLLTRSNSTVKVSDTPPDKPRLNSVNGQQSTEQALRSGTPDPKPQNRRSSLDNQQSCDDKTTRVPTERKQADTTRRPREGQAESRATSAVIRRTIILPSETKTTPFDLSTLTRKASNRRKRASGASLSARSVHDRVPTPPPPRSPTSKRFSNGPSPPVPHLPSSVASQSDNLLNVPSPSAGGPIEKVSSTYDSLYEMYAGESKPTSSANEPNAPDSTPASGDFSETGPALEIKELANGETIWSIVNGLRDDDEESAYTGRASFASEYSTREYNADSGLQLFVKEHNRAGSKGSTSSFLSRKKTLQGKQRPETKVYYSSSAQIGRLIEDLSQGMDAGSFNFLPNHAPGHSASSSLSTNDLHWTVEERLNHMLDSMRNPEAT